MSPTWTEKSAKKKAEAFAATFEKECREGTATDTRLRFSEYADYVISMKEERGAKHTTIQRYKELTTRIYPAIGHLKLKDIRVDHLNSLYSSLLKTKSGKAIDRATAKIDLAALLKKEGFTRASLSVDTKQPLRAVYAAIKGEAVSVEVAKAIAGTLGISLGKGFTVVEDESTLSPKTVLEYHRLVSTILDQAEKEQLVPFNVASKATLPKQKKKEANYFQPEEIAAIRDALENESIKWKTIMHLFLITGARRGEILGLKWDNLWIPLAAIYSIFTPCNAGKILKKYLG